MKYIWLLGCFFICGYAGIMPLMSAERPDSALVRMGIRANTAGTQTSIPSGITAAGTALVDGEQIPWILIKEVVIPRPPFSSPEARSRYLRLRYNVVKVLPYAHFAQQRYEQLYREIAMTGNKREQRRLVKNCEKEIKDMFNREVKNLTVTQGKILIKLIDRQTGNSSYEVVRELKGGITAFFYQSIAKVAGHNLKSHYDPVEDVQIETILQSLHYGPGGYSAF